ncbi:MAG: baseplate assembly protein W [Gammaproteobacteria bacterium]|nr:baseplate assembly protein W [Gammaproteobacteria bacterium]MDH5651687.1 baseplate assembly protein W [Gammaproteobacteria bacterium]
MNNKTGKRLVGVAWLRQRLADVLTTPVGTRLMRRGYGSRLFELIDQPMSPRWKIQFYAAVVEAVENPVNGLADFQVSRAQLLNSSTGKAELELWGVYVPTGELLKIESIKVA